jgi:probable HAF family extracellular repeat protein
MIALGDLPGGDFISVALGVSADGSVVVGASRSDMTSEAFLWTAGSGMVGLGDLPGGSASSSANDVSADGSVVVGGSRSAAGSEAFRWSSTSGMVGLGFLSLSVPESSALAVSGDGSIVVGSSESGGFESNDFAFIWDSTNGMRNLREVLVGMGLDLTGWTLREATDVSDDGHTIVGWGINPNGEQEGWLAQIPEPSSLALLGLGLGAAAMLRRARSD